MAIHLIIDGYNLIRQSKTLHMLDQEDIQAGRDALIDLLAAYKKLKAHKITVVFDGANAPLLSNRHNSAKGINIHFSRQGETADTVIKKIASSKKEKALIVSSDKDIVDFASSQGSSTVSSTEFEEKMKMAEYMMIKGIDEEEDDRGWVPTTKKKGPKKRLAKKKRRNRIKVNKL